MLVNVASGIILIILGGASWLAWQHPDEYRAKTTIILLSIVTGIQVFQWGWYPGLPPMDLLGTWALVSAYLLLLLVARKLLGN